MSEFPSLLLTLTLVLAVVTWGLFRLIRWLRGDPSRYFYFDLFAALFLLAFGLIFLVWGPRNPFSTAMGVLGVLSGGTGLGALFAHRFGLTGPTGMRYSFSVKTTRRLSRKGYLRCSFCNRSQNDVATLISGPAVFICDECVEICRNILAERSDPPPESPDPQPTVN